MTFPQIIQRDYKALWQILIHRPIQQQPIQFYTPIYFELEYKKSCFIQWLIYTQSLLAKRRLWDFVFTMMISDGKTTFCSLSFRLQKDTIQPPRLIDENTFHQLISRVLEYCSHIHFEHIRQILPNEMVKTRKNEHRKWIFIYKNRLQEHKLIEQ